MLVATISPLSAGEGEEPEISQVDGWVHGTIEIQADPATILALVRNPFEVARVGGRGVIVTELSQQEGGCSELQLIVPNALVRLRYRERSCLTPQGRHSTLLGSRDLAAYESSWLVEPLAGGTSARIRYKVISVPSFPAPRALVARMTARSVRRMLEGIRLELEAG